MINKRFFTWLKNQYKKQEVERKKIISQSNPILHSSKKTIFALHRDDIKQAEENFKQIEKDLNRMKKTFTLKRLNEEGAYKAAVEEYVEAKMFYFSLKGKNIDKITEVELTHDSYIAGLCDFTGELVRKSINCASEKNFEEVKKHKKTIREILSYLIDFDLTGYVRGKYDQAQKNLQKIEQIDYEIELKK